MDDIFVNECKCLISMHIYLTKIVIRISKEKPIAYTEWEKCLKKDRMHTLTCIKQTLFSTFNYLEISKLKIFKWKLIHFILPCKELLKQWRIVNESECQVCKKMKITNIFTLIVNTCITKHIRKRWKKDNKSLYRRSCFLPGNSYFAYNLNILFYI